MKYADVPFTHSMGAAEYSVPIYELQGRRITRDVVYMPDEFTDGGFEYTWPGSTLLSQLEAHTSNTATMSFLTKVACMLTIFYPKSLLIDLKKRE